VAQIAGLDARTLSSLLTPEVQYDYCTKQEKEKEYGTQYYNYPPYCMYVANISQQKHRRLNSRGPPRRVKPISYHHLIIPIKAGQWSGRRGRGGVL